ncbi:ABC transporter substrate-binding protein [Nocardia puris]|uniref:ABC-type branched-subunit amino acid transport system substrate-binding protein n=1 Tax=Nocardia puris TaxID=208602 RepID=A0A366DFR6_9NOCA|nr:hypothetical protein [Nocardia puris]RBO88339.1 hypothetical protein DFR74_109107 [Nocardia puris]
MSETTNDVGKLLELLRALGVPDAKPRVLRTMLRRRRPVPRPIVELTGPGAHNGLLVELYRWLGESGGRRATPRARVDLNAPDLPPDALAPDPNAAGEELRGHCLPIVQRLVEGFSTDDTNMGPIKFPRYRTADWLTRQRVTNDETEAAVELRSRLPRLLRSGSFTDRSDTAEGVSGDAISRLVFGVLALWPVLRLWLWISGRIPGMSKVTHWFMHQRYMAPELSDSFLGFATRLTATRRSDENEDQVAKLLVHAFLEDLRDAYRKRLWRPSGWRRTAYPVALLGVVEEAGDGMRLLRRINDIRNETGHDDPLVVIACLEREPARPPVRDLSRVGDLHSLDTLESLVDRPYSERQPDPVQRWLRNIENMRTNRLSDAWFLPLRAELPDPPDREVRDPEYAHLAVPPAPPLAARRSFVALCVLIPVLLAAALALVYIPPLRGAPCSNWPWTSGIVVQERDGECVGYSDNADHIFTDDPSLSAVQREVFRLNVAAADARRDNPRRPLITLVFFSGLSYVDTNTRYPHAQVEELAGIAVQQRRALAASDESEPLLRIVIANGGSDMRHATFVVDRQLQGLLRDDPTILGVIGMDRSNAETRRAIGRLGELGVPVVATTLSADGLERSSPLYFQAAPSNRTQARLIADYVRGARYPEGAPRAGQPRYTQVAIYQPEAPDDIYVNTLVDDLREELHARDIGYETLTWTEQQELNRFPAPCETADFDRGTLLFFAGRNDDFATFARSVTRGCLTGESPAILGNDTVTRLITDQKAMAALPSTLPVRYVAKAAPVMLGGAECVRGNGTLGDEPVAFDYQQLCAGLAALIADLREYPDMADYQPSWPGDGTGLAYDVVGLFLRAVRIGGDSPNRTAVAMQLREDDYEGVGGTLGFSSSRVADGSSLAILITQGVGQPGPQQCLVMSPRPADGDGCPAGTSSTLEEWISATE